MVRFLGSNVNNERKEREAPILCFNFCEESSTTYLFYCLGRERSVYSHPFRFGVEHFTENQIRHNQNSLSVVATYSYNHTFNPKLAILAASRKWATPLAQGLCFL